MNFSTKIFLKYAIQIAAVIDDYHDTLFDATKDIISTTSITINDLDILEQIDRHEQAARLYFDFGNKNPKKIQKPIFVKKIMSEVWFLSYIAQKYKELSLIQLKKLIYQKFNQEKELDPKLTENQYSLISWYLPKLSSNGVLEECGVMLHELSYAIDKAYDNLSIYFETIDCIDFVDKIYIKETLLLDKQPIVEDIMISKPESEKADDKEQTIEKLKREIKYLDGTIHDLKISKEYAQKDALRNILNILNNDVYGYPLSRLYMYMNEDDTPKEITACLENFFTSLENAGIRTVKAYMLGNEITINEENKRKFDVFKNDKINIGDEVVVSYPGFQCNGETMIKPIIKKKENKHD